MSKRALKKSKRRSKAVIPVLGITGLSLSLAGGATASTGEASTSQPHELFLGEEEVFDSSLSTFYTFDKENAGQTSLAQQVKLARGGGCGGCGCGHGGGGCGGHGGCGGGCAAHAGRLRWLRSCRYRLRSCRYRLRSCRFCPWLWQMRISCTLQMRIF